MFDASTQGGGLKLLCGQQPPIGVALDCSSHLFFGCFDGSSYLFWLLLMAAAIFDPRWHGPKWWLLQLLIVASTPRWHGVGFKLLIGASIPRRQGGGGVASICLFC